MRASKFLGLFLFFFTSWAHADYGCHFVMSFRLSSPLDSSDKKISIRFTCLKDMNLIAVSFYCEEAQKPPAYLVSVREDAGGLPADTVLTSAFVVPKGQSWVTVPVSDLPLRAGKVYHLVLEQDINRGSIHPVGIIGPHNFASIAYGDHLNAFDPQMETPDHQLNVLSFVNGKWQVLNRQPLFALHGSGSKVEGNAYDEAGEIPIYSGSANADPMGDVMGGEALHPHYGFTANGISVRVRRQGHPAAPLEYRVYIIDFMRHKTNLAFTGLALTPDQTSTSFQWVTIGFSSKDHPQPFPPECRFVVFQTDAGRAVTDSPGCADCYSISDVGNSGGLASAADLTFDSGPHTSREAYSTNGWTNWIDEFERDANVVILGPVNSNPAPTLPKPIPTPEPLFEEKIP